MENDEKLTKKTYNISRLEFLAYLERLRKVLVYNYLS
jgi:hypothetical protein